MLALTQLAEKSPFSTGGSSDHFDPAWLQAWVDTRALHGPDRAGPGCKISGKNRAGPGRAG